MCGDEDFLEGLSEHSLTHEQSILASVAGIAVRHWRSVDAARYAQYGRLFALSPILRTVGSVASAVSYGPPLNDPIHQDLEILAVLAGRKEAYVLGPVFFGLKRLTKVNAFRAPALALIMGVQIGDRHNLAKEYCNFLRHCWIDPGSRRCLPISLQLKSWIETRLAALSRMCAASLPYQSCHSLRRESHTP